MRILEGLNQEMLQSFAPNPGERELLPELSEAAQVALQCRILYKEGWDEHLAGHITYRLDNGNVLVNPWELTWDEITASDILTLDKDGNIVEGKWNVTPAIGLHLQLHELRPEIKVVMHNHPHWSGLWASMGRVPPIYDQTSAMVDGHLPLYDEYSGTFDDSSVTLAAAEALGDAKWALLVNHGTLIVGENLRQAHLRAITLEWRSKRAYQAELAGGATPLSDEQVTSLALADANGFPFLWEAMARRELRSDPHILD